jgi:hypothetical protein
VVGGGGVGWGSMTECEGSGEVTGGVADRTRERE